MASYSSEGVHGGPPSSPIYSYHPEDESDKPLVYNNYNPDRSKKSDGSQCLRSFTKPYRKDTQFSTIVTIIGLAIVALGLALYFVPSMWRGGVFPAMSYRIGALCALSVVGALFIASPHFLGRCIDSCLKCCEGSKAATGRNSEERPPSLREVE